MLNPLPPDRWDRAKAAHLLNRAGFGGPPGQVDALHKLGLASAVRSLVEGPAQMEPAIPPAWAKPQDLAARREMVQDMAALTANQNERQQIQRDFGKKMRREEIGQVRDLGIWWLERMRTTRDPLLEKLTLFWHGHFATSVQKVRNAYWMWLQNDTFRRNARGHFGALVKAVSRDPAMIIWLDLRESRPSHPNENFARELMELFTLGEGHYTEKDVTESARAFTGYRLNPREQTFRWAAFEHDKGEKEVLGGRGNFDGDAVIDLILAKPECARFITKKIWEFFVAENPEPKLLDTLTETFRLCDYEMRPLLMRIFASEEFYAANAVGTQIKSPIHWLVSTARTFETDYPSPFVLYFAMRQLGQIVFNPPSVKGWDGGKAWISTSTLLARYNLAGLFVETQTGPLLEGIQRAVRDLGFDAMDAEPPSVHMPDAGPANVAKFVSAEMRADPARLVDGLARRIFAVPAPGRERQAFLDFLATKPMPIDDATVRSLLHLMMSTPRFQLC